MQPLKDEGLMRLPTRCVQASGTTCRIRIERGLQPSQEVVNTAAVKAFPGPIPVASYGQEASGPDLTVRLNTCQRDGLASV